MIKTKEEAKQLLEKLKLSYDSLRFSQRTEVREVLLEEKGTYDQIYARNVRSDSFTNV